MTFTLSATDPGGSGTPTIHYSLNDGAVTTYTAAVPVTAEGTTTVKFRATDASANVEATQTVRIKIDKTAPVSTLSGVEQGGWYGGSKTFSITASDTLSGVKSIHFRVDGSALTTYTAAQQVTAEGTHTIEYFARDNAGNQEATKTVNFGIDKTKPNSSTDAQGEYSQSAIISITATDALSGPKSIAWRIDDGAFATVNGVSGQSLLAAQAATSKAGTHTLEYVVTDFAGNQEATKTATFHVTRQASFPFAARTTLLTNAKNPAVVTIASYLRDGAVGIPGQVVILDYYVGGKWKGLTSAMTDSTGHFKFTRKIYSRTSFRVRYPKTDNYTAAVSKTLTYVPRVNLSAPTAGRVIGGVFVQRAGRAFTASGRISPLHKAGTRIKVERYLIVRGRRISRGYVWAKVGKNRTTYAVRMVLGKGTWKLRAVAPYDYAHNATYSAYSRNISVR